MTTWQNVVEYAKRLPGVVESVSYGEPSLKCGRSLVARWRMEDDSLVLLQVEAQFREVLLDQQPETFFLEPHYEGYDIVLARLGSLRQEDAETFIDRRWRAVAPKRLLQRYDERES